MRLFKISTRFEQDGKWSDRKADAEGYLIKRDDEDDAVEGYVKMLYPTCYSPVRYIKGLYSKDGALVFLQMCNTYFLSPICYSFPDVNKEGYWSEHNERLGFFPVYPSMPCSRGHATVKIEEVFGENLNELAKETSAIFEENLCNASGENERLVQDFRALTDFLDTGMVFQMKLHCGKW